MKRSFVALMLGIGAFAQTPCAPPASPRVKLNFDLDWKFVRDDATGAEAPGFDDSEWATISLPHSFNDVDSFRQIISHGGGDRGTYKGLAWYRKHFKLPARFAGGKVFLEFEGMRQAGDDALGVLLSEVVGEEFPVEGDRLRDEIDVFETRGVQLLSGPGQLQR